MPGILLGVTTDLPPTHDALDWSAPGWRAAVQDWVADRLAEHGRTPTGPLQEVRLRPWSAVLRLPTDAGDVWFKANSRGSRYEAAVVAALADWTPAAVLTPLAVDTARGWVLTADAGPTLRDTLGDEPRLDRWAAMLTGYARFQRALAPRAGALVALGVPDLRPARMPGQLDILLADPWVRAGLPEPALAELAALRPAFADWCAELAADGLPASLQHDDLSDGNVFPTAAGYRFFDWGDACVAHPFGSLLVALSAAGHRFGLAPDAAPLRRLRDSYLQVWADGPDRARLHRSCLLATRVATVGRALSWRRALTGPGMPPTDEHRAAVPGWLDELRGPDLT